MTTDIITDVKSFTSALFIGETFDNFLVSEVNITTYNTFTIDGHIKKNFYTNEEYEELGSPSLSKWSSLKPLCFSIIKGKKLPLSFKIIFCLSKEATTTFLKENDLDFTVDNINGLFINIKFENNELSYVTGTSLNVFTMDKSLEQAFDSHISKFISTHF
ncbi:MAG: hypothetical protein E7270_11295 [Lachnospiraceae bacterium]|nr:hypothetical protein [Lachnospiraceae bacterium]